MRGLLMGLVSSMLSVWWLAGFWGFSARRVSVSSRSRTRINLHWVEREYGCICLSVSWDIGVLSNGLSLAVSYTTALVLWVEKCCDSVIHPCCFKSAPVDRWASALPRQCVCIFFKLRSCLTSPSLSLGFFFFFLNPAELRQPWCVTDGSPNISSPIQNLSHHTASLTHNASQKFLNVWSWMTDCYCSGPNRIIPISTNTEVI